MKKYKVIDCQGANFMDDTHDKPMTANELRSRFWCLDDCRTNKYKDFTVDYIQEMWAVEFEEVKNIKVCVRCGTEVSKSPVKGYKYYCPEHDEDLYSFEVVEKETN